MIGGCDNRPESILVSGCQREIEEETKRLVDQAGKTGVILGADCTLPRGVDLNRICWVVKTLQNINS